MIPFKFKKQAYLKGDKLIVSTSLIANLVMHAKQSPNKIAILTSDGAWSYQKLHAEVLTWKNKLRALSINGPTLVCVHRTPRMLALLLAMQWLRIPYIPVEITTPIKRIRAIIEDSKAQAMLHDTGHQEELISLPCSIWALNDLTNHAESDLETLPEELPPASNDPVYIIYTSGSTGNPKGVTVASRALNNFLASMSENFLKNTDDVMLATTTIAFDIAYLELYLPIWQGKTVFIANQQEHKDPEEIKNILTTHPITACQGTSSLWNMIYFSGWQGKKDLTMLLGGEPLNKQLVKSLLENTKEIWNMYGPTEATIWCSLEKIISNQDINVGKPIHNLEMMVLDSSKKPVARGTKGELYISGTGLAEGYINHQRLTDEKFTILKSGMQNKRIYHTGDIAEITEEGKVIIYGRVDNQVKLHGYRIELEDIESHIQTNHGVRECVVGVYNEQLVAYICINTNGQYNEQELIKDLNQELPEFMIPKRFVYLEKLPLNSSGKLDRKALFLPDNEIHNESNEDSTPLQETLQEIWQETLNITNIGINESFFELGGHSLLAARIVAQIKQILNKSIKIHDIYHAPTISELAELVNLAPKDSSNQQSIANNVSSTWVPLTDFQFVLWISNIFEPDVKKLNIVDRRRIQGPINFAALEKALQNLVANHEVFAYQINKFFPLQKQKKNNPVCWQVKHLEKYSTDVAEEYLYRSLKKLSAIRRWSHKKALIVAKLFYLDNNQIELQIAIPHLIADQQSIDIFFLHLSNAYMTLTKEDKLPASTKHKPFTDFAKQEYNLIQSSLHSDEKFWTEYLEEAELLNFPKQYVIPCNTKDANSCSTTFKLSEQQIQTWKYFCIENAITLNDLFCAAVTLALQNALKNKVKMPEQLFINTVKSSREDPCFDSVIGCFLKAQPIKLTLKDRHDLITLAKEAQKSNAETANHQYASSLIKLSSIGRVNSSPKHVKSFLISVFAKLYLKISKQTHNLNLPVLNACKRLAKVNSNRGFLININIWNSFFATNANKQLLGKDCQPIPIERKDISSINGLLDICLMRDELTNQAYLIVSANLQKNLRKDIGIALLKVLEQHEITV